MRAMQLAARNEKTLMHVLVVSQTCSHMRAVASQLAQMNKVRGCASMVEQGCYLP